MKQICAPVNLTGHHLIVMNVIMTNTNKVFITNHFTDDKLPVAKQYRSSNVKRALIWWAKWFSI